jgi:chromosome partition protein MukF
LNGVLMRDGPELQATLQELQELAASAGVIEVEEATRRLVEQVDRIAAWGAARQQAWSGYYQYVHRFLRDVVRLDPSRVVTHRVRERLASDGSAALALTVAAAPPLQVLREVVPPRGEAPPLRRRRPAAEPPLAQEPADDAEGRLDADVRGAMAAGARRLADVTARLTGVLPESDRFAAAGRIAQAIARVTRPDARAERPWIPVDGGLTIEEWILPEPE